MYSFSILSRFSSTLPHLPALALARGAGRVAIGSLVLGWLTLGWSLDASAHIVLSNPPSWVVEDSLGNPQKEGPCGGERGELTGVVSTYRAGSTIDVEWQEGVGHPGHFRISLASDRADFADPEVETTNGDGVSGVSIRAEIMSPPSYPVLMDGLFVRDIVRGPQEEPFVVQVELPDTPCEDCTLQVIQFMADHLPGYFYYHCADLRIVPADSDLPESEFGPSYPEVEVGGGDDEVTPTADSGCAFEPGSRSSYGGLLLLLALGLASARRRRD